jgi:hypothetical protein
MKVGRPAEIREDRGNVSDSLAQRLVHLLPAACIALTLVAGCAGPEQHAAQALVDARAVLAPIREDAARYFPAELAALDAQLASLDASLRRGDDAAVFTAVPALTDRLAGLRRQALAARAKANVDLEMARVEWSALAAELSERLMALDARVAELAAQRRLPPGLERAKFEAAKQALVAMKQSFKESATSETAGAAVDALASARELAAQAKELAVALGAAGAKGEGGDTGVANAAVKGDDVGRKSAPAKVIAPTKALEPVKTGEPATVPSEPATVPSEPARDSDSAEISPAPGGP